MILEIRNLCSGYGKTQILWNVSLSIAENEIVTILGSNGAGKTTLASTIMGVVRPWDGEIFWQGNNITGKKTEEIVKSGIVLAAQGGKVFGGMSVEDNLILGAYCQEDKNINKENLEAVYSIFPKLAERKKQKAGSLSGGERQMCCIGRALMSQPKVLIVDEMSTGLSPAMAEIVMHNLARVRETGVSIILIEQDVEIALEHSERAYVMEGGRIVKEGSALKIGNDPVIREAYLGL